MNSRKMKSILFTREISEKQRFFGSELGLHVFDHSFIEIEINALSSESIESIQSTTPSAWIFTSQNAVRSLEKSIPNLDKYKSQLCYAVGLKTAEALSKYQFEIRVPLQHNSQALVAMLAKESKADSYLYFAGNRRQKTISRFLEEQEFMFQEIECYKTNLIQPDIEVDPFDAICFCSPSAVSSFFKKYQIKKTVPCIAIGNTTAVKLLDYSEQVVMSDQTNVYSMLEICNEYLNS